MFQSNYITEKAQSAVFGWDQYLQWGYILQLIFYVSLKSCHSLFHEGLRLPEHIKCYSKFHLLQSMNISAATNNTAIPCKYEQNMT